MLIHYLKVAIRNITLYKGFAFMTMVSLMIGIAGCLLIGLFVRDEYQYDTSIPGQENIYRLYDKRSENNAVTHMAVVAPAYATFLQEQYPEVELTARMMMLQKKHLLEVGEKKGYEENGQLVDSSFLHMFPLHFSKGNQKTALAAPFSIVLSEDLADRYFDTDPLGQTILIDKQPYKVTGVFSKLPVNFHLSFDYLMSLSSSKEFLEEKEDWTWQQFYTYVKLKPDTRVQTIQNRFQEHVKKQILPKYSPSTYFVPFFQPLKEIHLKSADFIYDNAIRGNVRYVNGLSIVAIFVLMIACFNFVNLAIARSFKKSKEIGVRKVTGAGRKQLIFQFITESVLYAVVSTFYAVFITMAVLPWLNRFTGKSIVFNPFLNAYEGIILLLMGIIIGILAGLYPAFILSGFKPIIVLRNTKPLKGSAAFFLRHSLVVLQFMLTIILIIATVVVYNQTKYMRTKDVGFNREQLLYFEVKDQLATDQSKLEAFKTMLKSKTNIVSVTSGYGLPGDLFAGETLLLPSIHGDKQLNVNMFIGDYDYINTLGLQLIAGRDFSRDMPTDVQEAFIVNETAVQAWGLLSPEKALGQSVHWEKWNEDGDSTKGIKKGRIIGVVKDFHYKNLYEKITPIVIHILPWKAHAVAVRLKTIEIQNTIGFIKQTYEQFTSGFPLDYKFLDETFNKMYQSEEKLSDLLWIFSLLSIIIGCMGLYGLVKSSLEQRIKEIGIRKVLGASLFDIIHLIAKSYLLLILIASFIAIPIAWWAALNWLQNFPYRIAMDGWVFFAGVFIALFIAFITIVTQSINAAITNPAENLKVE
jgi:putative ABC transport system permease protein